MTQNYGMVFKGKEKKEVPGRTLKKLKSGEEIDQSILRRWQ